MDNRTQPSTFDAPDAGQIDAIVGAADANRPHEPVTVEYGSGWYHDAEIAASAQPSVQKH